MQYLFLDESGNIHKNSSDRFFVIGGIYTNNYTDMILKQNLKLIT